MFLRCFDLLNLNSLRSLDALLDMDRRNFIFRVLLSFFAFIAGLFKRKPSIRKPVTKGYFIAEFKFGMRPTSDVKEMIIYKREKI